MTNDPKKTQLGWVPAYPEVQTQPYQQPPPEYLPPEYVPQGYAQQPPYPQQYVQHQQFQQYHAQQYAVPQYPPPQPGQQSYPQPQPAHQSYPPASAYNYQPEAAAIVQHMQREEAAASQARAKKQSGRSIPSANATQGASDRVRFIRLTYLHLLGAILAFAGLLWLFMNNTFLATKVSAPLVRFALGGRWNWGVVLAAFMAASWVADQWASHAKSRGVQYLGLAFYVLAEALIFVPLLAVVAWKTQAIIARGGGNPNIIRDSAYVTLGIFTALTASVFVSKKDFSFLRSGLVMASGAALTLIILALTFGFNLGLAFSAGMVLLAGGYILYQTSQVLAHYDPRNHVAAALALFSSVALMFWYVIRIFMRMRE